jgi:hypothetical protein
LLSQVRTKVSVRGKQEHADGATNMLNFEELSDIIRYARPAAGHARLAAAFQRRSRDPSAPAALAPAGGRRQP